MGNYVIAQKEAGSELQVDENFEHAGYSYDIVGSIHFITGVVPHYVVYIKKGGSWRKADDSVITTLTTIDEALTTNTQKQQFPMVMLYRRRVGTDVGRHEGVGEMAYGIKNRGSECFANALIQLLLNIPELVTMWYVGKNDSCGVASTLVGRNLKVKVGKVDEVECIGNTQANEWLETCGYEVTGVSTLPKTNERFVGYLVKESNTLVPYAWRFQRLCKFEDKSPGDGDFPLADLDTADDILTRDRYEVYVPFHTKIISPMFNPVAKTTDKRMQTDGCNCGVFVCAYAYYLGQDQQILSNLQTNINKFRKYIAHSILNGDEEMKENTLSDHPFNPDKEFDNEFGTDLAKKYDDYVISNKSSEQNLEIVKKAPKVILGSVQRLAPGEWLNDESITYFMSLLTKSANHDKNYAFHNTLTTSNLIEEVNVDERKIISRYKDLFVNPQKELYQKIFFAHNQSNNHYNLLFLELDENKTYTIQVIDSLGTKDNDGLAREFKTAVDKIFFHAPQIIYTVDFGDETAINPEDDHDHLVTLKMPKWMAVTNILTDAGAIRLRYKYKVDAETTYSYEDLKGKATIVVNKNLKVITQSVKGVHNKTNLVEICVIDKYKHRIGNVITTDIQEVY